MQNEKLKDRLARYKESKPRQKVEELKASARREIEKAKKDNAKNKPEILTKYLYNPSENWIG